jgi:hypothetical protein
MKEFCMSVHELRKNSRSDFEDKLYKLILNALYGKTIMDEIIFCNIFFITDPDKIRKEMKDISGLYTLSFIFPDMAFMMKKLPDFDFSSPVGIGFAVLGLSKWLVARHCILWKEKCGDNKRAIQTDTDIIIFKLYEEDLYEDLKLDLEEKNHLEKEKIFEELVGGNQNPLSMWLSNIFDLYSLPKYHTCFNKEHRKCFGYLNVENKGNFIEYFVAPVVKGYLEVLSSKEKVTLKYVP